MRRGADAFWGRGGARRASTAVNNWLLEMCIICDKFGYVACIGMGGGGGPLASLQRVRFHLAVYRCFELVARTGVRRAPPSSTTFLTLHDDSARPHTGISNSTGFVIGGRCRNIYRVQ